MKRLNDSKYEIENADYFFVASEFSKESLLYSGIKKNRIFVCRYGINIDISSFVKKNSEKIRIIFIGDVTQKKGIVDFMQIVRALNINDFEFNVVGKYAQNDDIYMKNKDICEFYGYVTHDKVLSICENMDIIIFPSLADGFGLSVMEAMSKKILPIVSKNAGVSDIIINGINGFLFDVGDNEAVIDYCRLLKEDRITLQKMQNEAFNCVSNMKWTRYYEQIGNAIEKIFES